MSNDQFTFSLSIIAIHRPFWMINFSSWGFGFDLEFGICHLNFNPGTGS
jgi:hypothetical protein